MEYRVPIAKLLAVAVMGVCFVIALLVINLQGVGRRRVLGLLGVVLLAVSTILQSLNGSMAGAYGTDTDVYAAGSILAAVLAAAGLVLLALAAVRARARATRGEH